MTGKFLKYKILLRRLYIYHGEKRLDIEDYHYHNEIDCIKIKKLSENQKYLMIQPSVEFCYDIFSSENIFNVKSRLFYLMSKTKKPSKKLIYANEQLEEIFELYYALLKEKGGDSIF